jgi:hypothetical protein
VEKLRIRLNSAQFQLKLPVGAELGKMNNKMIEIIEIIEIIKIIEIIEIIKIIELIGQMKRRKLDELNDD